MKVALVYDRINKWGGAERVLLALKTLFPDAPLFTSVYLPRTSKWAKEFDIRTSFVQRLPFAASTHEVYPLFMPIAFEQFNFDGYDVVISVTSEAAKGILTKPPTKHICYCLTPTRYLWSGYDEYFSNPALKLISRPAVSYLKTWDRAASARPDTIIAISTEVKRRISNYYDRDSEIIYPPLMLSHNSSEKGPSESDFFLIVARLVPYKRIDLAIEACNRLQVPLKIVGTGSDVRRLRSMSGPTVEFVGSLTDDELVPYYRQCAAFLFPGSEDFGLTMVEAQSFGKPVVAFKEGGALDIVREGKTGVFFTSRTPQSLQDAIHEVQSRKWDHSAISKNAERFSLSVFQESFKKTLLSTLESKSA
jgi:glycosyltransferase involved in cell wall biosynthesis